MAAPATLLMLVGAATPPGRLAAAIDFAAAAARSADGALTVDILSLADVPVDICDGRPMEKYGATTQDAVKRVVSAGAVLIAAPVYRASYPGVLKNLLDITPVEAFRNKPVGIVAMGGSPHHFLGVDWQLREVLTWFGALVAPTSVYLTGGDFQDGKLASEGGRNDMAALVETLTTLMRAGLGALGPKPLAARFT